MTKSLKALLNEGDIIKGKFGTGSGGDRPSVNFNNEPAPVVAMGKKWDDDLKSKPTKWYEPAVIASKGGMDDVKKYVDIFHQQTPPAFKSHYNMKPFADDTEKTHEQPEMLRQMSLFHTHYPEVVARNKMADYSGIPNYKKNYYTIPDEDHETDFDRKRYKPLHDPAAIAEYPEEAHRQLTLLQAGTDRTYRLQKDIKVFDNSFAKGTRQVEDNPALAAHALTYYHHDFPEKVKEFNMTPFDLNANHQQAGTWSDPHNSLKGSMRLSYFSHRIKELSTALDNEPGWNTPLPTEAEKKASDTSEILKKSSVLKDIRNNYQAANDLRGKGLMKRVRGVLGKNKEIEGLMTTSKQQYNQYKSSMSNLDKNSNSEYRNQDHIDIFGKNRAEEAHDDYIANKKPGDVLPLLPKQK